MHGIGSAAIDLRRTDIKQQNKNVNWFTFVFKHVNNTRWKQEVKWYNLQRNTSGKTRGPSGPEIAHLD